MKARVISREKITDSESIKQNNKVVHRSFQINQGNAGQYGLKNTALADR